MRKMFLLLLLVPLIGIGQSNVINSFRVFPKPEKILEFEKAFISHAQKYHTGEWKWNVWEIQSGPQTGGFLVVEGPMSWDQFDKRGNLGDAHMADWAKNVAPNTADRGTSDYYEFDTDLSSVAITDYADKILINHTFSKPGKVGPLAGLIKRLKKVWTESNESVAVYSSVGSGEPEYLTVLRMKNGLKELSDEFRKPMPERYNASYGEGSWNYFLEDYSRAVEKRWSEILFKRPDMSTR